MNPLTLGTLMVTAATAAAQVHSGDIVLSVRDGRLTTGYAAGPSQIRTPTFVFAATFGEAPNFTNDPGIESTAGTFPGGARVGFTIRRALRAWNGSSFDAIPQERIQVRLGPLGPVLTPLTDAPVVGFSMAANSLGEFHHHPGYTLLAPASPGIYLLELELWTNLPSVATSLPLWIVFNQNSQAQAHQAAMDWTYLTHVCPADLNLDQFTDFNDYLEFLNLFNLGDPRSDFNRDGITDFNDYLEFLNQYNQGCPE